MLVVATLLILIVGVLITVGLQVDSKMSLIEKTYPQVEFDSESIQKIELNKEEIISLKGNINNGFKPFIFLFKENILLYSNYFDTYPDKNNTISWFNATNSEPNYSIIGGIYNTNWVDQVEITGIDKQQISLLKLDDQTKLFFTLDKPKDSLVKITGLKKGIVVFKNYPK
ncbi:hypothetical protein [Paenibacillus amylolyticus]|uniref:hypothetical protein n=1 Tax=Paenibacillus amylolyticus TaxID=1451 RepID=UPI00196081CB|nr:hypothetical protein [Paenibacillus amylolyticus]